MMTNLFSIFDPSSSASFSMNWLSIMMIVMWLPSMYWLIPSRFQILWFIISSLLVKEMNNLFSKNKKKYILLTISIFWFILMNNFMGLYPYIFTATSHINLTTILALPLWLTIMIFGWINQTNSMFSHLVPLGTPMILSVFMVLIETISNLIRPLTLSVRLTANMISGHLLLCLLSEIMQNFPDTNMFIFPIMAALLTLEMAVAIIQSYVFIILISLYLNELN
uniref:ATP synthase subunit a n=1 Tax=Ornithodoros waterbergensis TaxID=1580575 RepID=A0A1P8AGB6_9ACAR|nr:ATP synthase F0 subunit 6 [Ornithodoros waterbergensis]AIZ58594.1 ATP synthase F0 subunit 6 [Ornithodoros waterbergensis]AMX74157.1 ATP synthase F0 subunit 6 [Ornithodoros waterbergensis]UYL27162.1 ATP synthase F0 subunit 6 [Ornithodoros waterbergensis]